MKNYLAILLTLVSLNAMSMGFPSAASSHYTNKSLVAENTTSVKSLTAYAEAIPQEVATKTEECNKFASSIVEKITNVIVNALSLDTELTQEEEVQESVIVRAQDTHSIHEKVFLLFVNNVACYMDEEKKRL